MTYKEAKETYGRYDRSNYPCYLDRYLWLQKCDDYYALDFSGCRDLIRWYPNGKVVVYFPHIETRGIHRGSPPLAPLAGSKGIHPGYGVRWRIQHYFPYNWVFYPLYYHLMIRRTDETHGRECPAVIEFDKKGKIVNESDLGLEHNVVRNHYDRYHYRNYKIRRRGQYWIRRERNLYVDHSKCTATSFRQCYGRPGWRRNGNRPQTLQCGCVLYRKNIKFRRKAQDILHERNATVRSAQIKLYGVARFFEDIGSRSVHKYKNWELLNIDMPPGDRGASNIRALRMVCPSTGTTYVHVVPRDTPDVQRALDYMKGVPNWLERVQQHT